LKKIGATSFVNVMFLPLFLVLALIEGSAKSEAWSVHTSPCSCDLPLPIWIVAFVLRRFLRIALSDFVSPDPAARGMTDAVDTNYILACRAVPPDAEKNPILVPAFAVEKLPDLSTKVFAFRSDRAA
jgi:hypothetical protein